MAVTEQTPINTYTANGATLNFPFSFLVLSAADLVVTVNGVEASQNVDYTIAGIGIASGGSVTFGGAPADQAIVMIFRRSRLKRDRDYQTNGDLLADALDDDVDRLWLALQELIAGLFGALPAPGSAAALQGRLSNGASDSDGAAMVAYNPALSYAAGSVGAALAAASGVNAVDTVAALRGLTNETTVAQTLGYWKRGDGGHAVYALQPLANPSPGDNGGTVIERADGRWYAMQVQGDFISVASCGVYCPSSRLEAPAAAPGYFNRWSGAVPSAHLVPAFLPASYSTTDRLHAAFSQARALGKGSLIDGIPHCDKQVVIDAPTRIRFAGRTGNAGGNLEINLPASYLFQANTAMVGSVVLQILHDGIRIEGGGAVIGPVYYDAAANFLFPEGPARDGVFVGGNACVLEGFLVARMGRDGFRHGDYAGGAGTNANGAHFVKCVSAYNGNNGLTVNDASGSLDANAADYSGLFCHHNQNAGIELANTYLGGVFHAPIVENNARGWFINSSVTGVLIVGGDTEANTGWRGDLSPPFQLATPLNNIQEDPAVAGQNFFIEHSVQGVVRNDIASGSTIRHNHAGRTGLFLENLSSSVAADAVVGLETTAGAGAVWKRSAAVGGELFVGNDQAYPVAFITNNIIRGGFLGDGSLALGGLSDIGTPGQVMTSQGPGNAPIWASAGGGGGGSPLTTKGDLFTYSTLAARLAVGANGQVLMADSATATGIKWATVSGSGTVTSVAMSVPTGFSVAGSPITGAGTFAVTYAAGFVGYTTAEQTKLASITVANLALKTAANTFIEAQTVSKNQNAPTGAYVANTNSGSNANAEVLLTADGGAGGMRLLSVAAGGQLVFGNVHSGEVAIMQNGVFRIVIDAAGNIEFRGLPTGSSGMPERVWRDGSGYLRIG